MNPAKKHFLRNCITKVFDKITLHPRLLSSLERSKTEDFQVRVSEKVDAAIERADQAR